VIKTKTGGKDPCAWGIQVAIKNQNTGESLNCGGPYPRGAADFTAECPKDFVGTHIEITRPGQVNFAFSHIEVIG
jgi:hypothetical protein